MHKHVFYFLSPLLGLAVLSGCSAEQKAETAIEQPTAQVSVTTAQVQPVHFVENLPARVQAYRIAEIRPQVGGIIEKVLFSQGSEVKAGQALFKINADIFHGL